MGFAERVADDGDLRDPFTLHGLPQLVRVEVPAFHRDDRAAEQEHLKRRELTRAVHERRRRQVDRDQSRLAYLAGELTHRLRIVGELEAEERVGGGRERTEEVFVAPHHGLGHAGGATGIEKEDVVARALDPFHRRRAPR